MNGAWTMDDLRRPRIFVPRTSAFYRCREKSPDRYICTRRQGHTGRHAAIITATGMVYAVWPEPEATA